jgi:hypothetical protein
VPAREIALTFGFENAAGVDQFLLSFVQSHGVVLRS